MPNHEPRVDMKLVVERIAGFLTSHKIDWTGIEVLPNTTTTDSTHQEGNGKRIRIYVDDPADVSYRMQASHMGKQMPQEVERIELVDKREDKENGKEEMAFERSGSKSSGLVDPPRDRWQA